jgi:hypothetical protein
LSNKKTNETIEKINQILKDADNLLNADSEYSKLNEKLKSGTISKEELKTLSIGIDELQYWSNKIENSVSEIKKTTDDLKTKKS